MQSCQTSSEPPLWPPVLLGGSRVLTDEAPQPSLLLPGRWARHHFLWWLQGPTVHSHSCSRAKSSGQTCSACDLCCTTASRRVFLASFLVWKITSSLSSSWKISPDTPHHRQRHGAWNFLCNTTNVLHGSSKSGVSPFHPVPNTVAGTYWALSKCLWMHRWVDELFKWNEIMK